MLKSLKPNAAFDVRCKLGPGTFGLGPSLVRACVHVGGEVVLGYLDKITSFHMCQYMQPDATELIVPVGPNAPFYFAFAVLCPALPLCPQTEAWKGSFNKKLGTGSGSWGLGFRVVC